MTETTAMTSTTTDQRASASDGSAGKRLVRACQRGFTLIEILIAVAILALLTAIALPQYNSYVARGARTAAQTVMMDMASKQEQYLLVNRTYGSASAVLGTGYALPSNISGKYDFTITTALSPEPTYLITFTPKGGHAADPTLTLNNAGVKSPASAW